MKFRLWNWSRATCCYPRPSDHALARYQAIRTDGTRVDNVEHFEFRDSRITHIDACVGAGDGAPWAWNV
jgi:hypothetical protein